MFLSKLYKAIQAFKFLWKTTFWQESVRVPQLLEVLIQQGSLFASLPLWLILFILTR